MICSSENLLFLIVRPSLGFGLYLRLEEFCRGRSEIAEHGSCGAIASIVTNSIKYNHILNKSSDLSIIGHGEKQQIFSITAEVEFISAPYYIVSGYYTTFMTDYVISVYSVYYAVILILLVTIAYAVLYRPTKR
jgi:hypothetical protein